LKKFSTVLTGNHKHVLNFNFYTKYIYNVDEKFIAPIKQIALNLNWVIKGNYGRF